MFLKAKDKKQIKRDLYLAKQHALQIAGATAAVVGAAGVVFAGGKPVARGARMLYRAGVAAVGAHTYNDANKRLKNFKD